MPAWNETPSGLLACLDSLFRHSPPTALIIGDAPLFIPVQQFLARRGLLVPEQVSLFSVDPDPAFVWCDPGVSHIRWDYRPIVRRVLGWANHVALGKQDRRQTLFDATFVDGATIGPASRA